MEGKPNYKLRSKDFAWFPGMYGYMKRNEFEDDIPPYKLMNRGMLLGATSSLITMIPIVIASEIWKGLEALIK